MEVKKAKDTSRLFKLVEWKQYRHVPGANIPLVPDRNPEEKKDPRPQDAVQYIQKKWVYVFWTTKDFSGLFLELWVDYDRGRRRILMTPIDPSHNLKERDERPAPNPADASDWLQWPHTMNGRPVYYHAFVSRIRLPKAALVSLHAWLQLQPAFALRSDAEFLQFNGGTWHLPVTDPFTVAINLNRRFQQARNNLLNYTTVYEGQPSKTRERAEERLKMNLLAESVKAVVQSSTEFFGKVEDDFYDGSVNGYEELRAVVQDFDNQVRRKARLVNRRAALLCLWLRSGWMVITEATYRAEEEQDMPTFLTNYAASLDRIAESGPGKAFVAWCLGEAENDANHIVQKYVFRTSEASGTEVAVIKKAVSPILRILKGLIGVYIKKQDAVAVRSLAKTLEYLLGGTVAVGRAIKSAVFRQSSGSLFRRVQVEFLFLEITPASINKYIADVHGSKLFAQLGATVTVVNYALSLFTLQDIAKKEGLTLYRDTLGFAVSTISTVNTVRGLLVTSEIGEQAVRRVGVVTALLDTVLSAWDASKAADRSDYDQMAGYLIAATGSFAAALGTTLVVAGVAGIGTPLAFVGALVAAAGGIIAVLAADDDWELFISHCRWGRAYQEGGYAGAWAIKRFDRWDLDTEVRVLRNLLSAFTISGPHQTPFDVRMYLGQIHEESVVRVRWEYKRHRQEPLTTERYTLRIAETPEIVKRGSDKRTYINVPRPKELVGAYEECTLYVRFDFDDALSVPQLGDVKVPLFEGGTYAHSGSVNSKRF